MEIVGIDLQIPAYMPGDIIQPTHGTCRNTVHIGHFDALLHKNI